MSDKREQLLTVVEGDIQQDCADYQALHGLMQELYEALLVRDCAQIDRLNAQVEPRIEAVRQRAERRSKVLAALRLAPAAEGMRHLLGGYPTARRTRLESSWQQLGTLAEQCRRLNERNGQLLAMHHEILSQLLAAQAEGGLYRQASY